MKHSPGPWKIGEHSEYRDIWAADKYRICQLVRTLPMRECDARLIAAAPELLEALEDASHYFYGEHHPDNPTCKRIRAALAKATGGAE